MPMTPAEKRQAVKDLRAYPAGVDSDSWGTGPLEKISDATAVFRDFTAEVLREYG